MATAASVAAVAVTLAGCSTPEEPIAVTHVHAVDIDDQRGAIYVATHEGILRVATAGDGPEAAAASMTQPDEVTRLGEWMGDVMGMTRLDDTLYISGHPAPGSDAPANIGVYEIDVRGREVEALSLEGEVDFHSMTLGGVALASYGLAGIDSVTGSVMVSRDRGQTWTPGAAIAARALSWDARAEQLFATTEQGLQVSTDDGKTFALVDGAPSLLLVASSPTGTAEPLLAGIDVDGVVHTSPDGITWTAVGAAPSGADALSVSSRGVLVTAGVEGVQRSDDGGATWNSVTDF
ncbi:hypothetical protein OVN18_07680 [Microcella daejeonensis]|uniref:BNR/Asp-box repeat protein n=1 Tax=Microcella daejeonensis TaxID=2994971 RepID=A0A9E8MJ03_9MICO|nr:hypothetical protein [Microcella daejeonensis]WAB80455.1 hypothetical protein OVN18_07680 [Microcella daejeonensis]